MRDERFEVLNTDGLDPDTLALLWNSPERPRCLIPIVEQWILNTVHRGIQEGIVAAPPPIVNRFFTGLHSGMSGMKKCYLISFTKFPTPYAIMVNALLVLHLVYTAGVAASTQTKLVLMCPMVFCTIFAFWCINLIAMELEHPFGDDVNDINLHAEQREMNEHLLVLLDPRARHLPNCADLAVLAGPDYRKCQYSTEVMKEGGNPEFAMKDGSVGIRPSIFNKLASDTRVSNEKGNPMFTDLALDVEKPVAPPTVATAGYSSTVDSQALTQALPSSVYVATSVAHNELRDLVGSSHQQHQQLAEGILDQLKQQTQTKDLLIRIQERQSELLNQIAESCSRFFIQTSDINYAQTVALQSGRGAVEMNSCTPWPPFVQAGGAGGVAPRRNSAARLRPSEK